MFSKILATLFIATMTLVAGSVAAQTVAPGKFVEINPPQPTEPGKTEVLEFFAYSCPHCAVLEPMLQKWIKTLPADVVVKQVPVAFNASMKPLAQLYYSLEAMNKMELHPMVFKAIHDDKKRIFTKAEMADWIATQGVDKAKFEAVFDSFGVVSKTQRAEQLVKAYNVQGTPSIAVAGKYLTSPSEAGGYQETIDVANALVKKVQAK